MSYNIDPKEAEALLKWAGEQNPGPWVEHSLNVGRAAQLIAIALQENGEDVNPTYAYICGVLHDIGRYKGLTPSNEHAYDGYEFLLEKGFVDLASVCITHCFVKDIELEAYTNGWNRMSVHKREKISEFINQHERTIYDDLICLCDGLGESTGITILERRLVSVTLRHGAQPRTPDYWWILYRIKERFEKIIGTSLYTLFPGIEESIYRTMP